MTSTARFRLAIRAFVLANTMAVIAWDQSAPPRICYFDLVSGPNSRGQNNVGAFKSLYIVSILERSKARPRCRFAAAPVA
jgi:hypothetical protein